MQLDIEREVMKEGKDAASKDGGGGRRLGTIGSQRYESAVGSCIFLGPTSICKIELPGLSEISRTPAVRPFADYVQY
jgi:hypothetical protein